MSEFDLIARFFRRPAARPDVVLGVGDDAAILRVPPGRELVVSIDTLVSGVHFLPDADPAALGHKALAVNLSDLAAMGAEPAWATLALTLPAADERWLAAFSEGFHALARTHGVDLVGGDTTRGPLSITVQVHGFAAPGAAFRRDGARPGDLVYVTGTLGDAGLALRRTAGGQASCVTGHELMLRDRLDRPTPRVREALALRGLVTAAIDVSDGLVADLGHVLAASGVGATIELAAIPLSESFRACADSTIDSLGRDAGGDAAWAGVALTSGDDYELCFTASADCARSVEAALEACGARWSRIGSVEAQPGLRCLWPDGSVYVPARGGYDQFPDARA